MNLQTSQEEIKGSGLMEEFDWDYKTTDGDFVFGGYDAKSCVEKIRKTYDAAYADVILEEPTPGDAGRMEAGNVRETEVINLWVAAMDEKFIKLIPSCDRSAESKLRRGKMTLETMRDPGDVIVIINARLPQLWATHRTGEPDALLRDGKNALGQWVWLPVDMKDHKSLEGARKNLTWKVSTLSKPEYSEASEKALYPGVPQKVDALQLAHYHRMLETLGHASEEPRGAIIGRESILVWHHLNDALYGLKEDGKTIKYGALDYYDKAFEERLSVAKAAKKGVALTGPEWKAECKGCPFRGVCHDELKMDLDHITLLPGITPSRAVAHYKNGITTVAELSRLHHPTAVLIDAGINVLDLISVGKMHADNMQVSAILIKPTEQEYAALKKAGVSTVKDLAKLDIKTAGYSDLKVWNLAASIDQARVTKVGKVHRPRGVDFIDIPRMRIEEDIDIEDAPHPNGEGSIVYMIGVRDAGYSERTGENIRTRTEYHCFSDYSGTDEGERKVFSDFWAHITHMRQHAKIRKYGYRAFHYTQHEDSMFRNLALKHAGHDGIPTIEEVNAFLSSKVWVDLHPIAATQMIWPTESVTLKDTAKWVQFTWRDSDPSGDNSIAWYYDAVNHPDPKVRLENQKRLAEYNADDCHAQLEIRNWLSRQGETRQPGKALPSVADLDRRFYRPSK